MLTKRAMLFSNYAKEEMMPKTDNKDHNCAEYDAHCLQCLEDLKEGYLKEEPVDEDWERIGLENWPE